MLSRVRLFMEIEPGTTADVGTITLLKVAPTELEWERVHCRLSLTACQAHVRALRRILRDVVLPRLRLFLASLQTSAFHIAE